MRERQTSNSCSNDEQQSGRRPTSPPGQLGKLVPTGPQEPGELVANAPRGTLVGAAPQQAKCSRAPICVARERVWARFGARLAKLSPAASTSRRAELEELHPSNNNNNGRPVRLVRPVCSICPISPIRSTPAGKPQIEFSLARRSRGAAEEMRPRGCSGTGIGVGIGFRLAFGWREMEP